MFYILIMDKLRGSVLRKYENNGYEINININVKQFPIDHYKKR